MNRQYAEKIISALKDDLENDYKGFELADDMSRAEKLFGKELPAIIRKSSACPGNKPDRAESFASPTDRHAIANGCPCISKPVGIEAGSDAGAFGKPCGE